MFFLALWRPLSDKAKGRRREQRDVQHFPYILNIFDVYFMHASCPDQVALSKYDLSSCISRVFHDYFENFCCAIHRTDWVHLLPLRSVYNCNWYHVSLSDNLYWGRLWEGGGISCFFVRQMFSFLKQKSLTSILCMPIDQDQTKWHKISVSDILLFCSTYKNNLNMISLLASPDCSTNSSKHFAVLFAGIHLLSLDEVQTCKGVLVFAYKLYWNGFLATSEHFSQGVDHPCFYSLLKMCLSYRNVKCKLCSFHRYRNFARA